MYIPLYSETEPECGETQGLSVEVLSPLSPREREVVAPPRIGHRREDLGSSTPPPRSVQLELPSCRHLPVLGDFYGFYLWGVA